MHRVQPGCLTRLQQGKQPSCAVNPRAMRETRFAERPAIRRKKVVIVGGGVAGMEAARAAAERGHSVTLYEKRDGARRQSAPRRLAQLQERSPPTQRMYKKRTGEPARLIYGSARKLRRKSCARRRPTSIILAARGSPGDSAHPRHKIAERARLHGSLRAPGESRAKSRGRRRRAWSDAKWRSTMLSAAKM